MSAFNRLLAQIDAFIRKYYKNQILKGILLFIGVLLLTYVLVITLEYFGRFNSIVRGTLFFSFVAVNGYLLVKYILVPLFRLKSFGKRINRYQASEIIGRFFPDVSDRLLNTLQLNDQLNENSADYELLNASVQQRSASMSAVPFSNAIDLKENKKHLKWLLPIVGIVLVLVVLAPGLFKNGTERVVNFSKEFKIEAPFIFSFLGDQAGVEEGEDYRFEVELKGDKIPEKVYVRSKQGRALLKRKSKTTFEGELAQLRESTDLQFEAMEFKSEVYAVNVISKTALGKMQATLVYPDYLGLEDEQIENAGDLTIPEGTKVKWSVLAKNTKSAQFWIGNKQRTFDHEGFEVAESFVNNANGRVVLENKQSGKRDTTYFDIDVVKDNFPSIQVSEVKDSVKDGIRYFSGVVADDHGLAGLSFVYEIKNKNGEKRKERMNASRVYGTESPFDFAVDFRREKISLEDEIEYYFVITDNDGVNGGKSSRSRRFQYKLPTLEDLNEKREEEQTKTKEDLSDVLKKAEKFKEDLRKLRNESMNSNQSNWNNQNQVEQLKEDHNSLLEDLESIQEEMNNSVEEKNQLSEIDEELLEQQELIKELLEELMDDELKDLLEQLEELMKENNKEKMDDALEELEMSSEDMKKQLDRSLEMLKRLQVNEKIDDIEEELKELAKEQDELRKDTEGDKKISEEDKKRQDEINEKFDELTEDLEELDSLNQDLKTPMELGDQEKKEEEITEDLNESKENLDKNKGKKANESQKDASEKMEQMANDLNTMQQESNQQQQQEDMDMLRNILESLVTLSFDQEEVMHKLKRVKEGDPAFRKYSRTQRKIVDDTKVVRDSLFALAVRQPKIARFIDKELNDISVNHELTLKSIDEFQDSRSRASVPVYQQYVMTGYNNLALMLNESLQQMQQQMQNMMQGSGSCDKPGGKGQGKPSSGKMSTGDMKEMLKKQLEQMKKGNNPNGKQPGDKPGQKPGQGKGQGMMGMGNKEIAKMAAQQSAMRKRLEQMRKELNKDGKGLGNKLNPLINELEKQEQELVNKRINQNTIKRQRDILTRLLESEKALMERGWDEKRESKEGKNENNGNLIRFDEYNKEKLKQIELLRAVDPAYRKYYKDRANEYFNRTM